MSLQVNAATIDGVTPLYNSCASGSDGCLELLLRHGALVLAPVAHKHFPSALHEACRRGEETINQFTGVKALHATRRTTNRGLRESWWQCAQHKFLGVKEP